MFVPFQGLDTAVTINTNYEGVAKWSTPSYVHEPGIAAKFRMMLDVDCSG